MEIFLFPLLIFFVPIPATCQGYVKFLGIGGG